MAVCDKLPSQKQAAGPICLPTPGLWEQLSRNQSTALKIQGQLTHYSVTILQDVTGVLPGVQFDMGDRYYSGSRLLETGARKVEDSVRPWEEVAL